MERRLRARVPELQHRFILEPVDHEDFRQLDAEYRFKQAENFNRRHRVSFRERPLQPNEPVFTPDRRETGMGEKSRTSLTHRTT